MSTGERRYSGPNLHLTLARDLRSSGAEQYKWQVTMKAADAAGSRKLGYRASGRIMSSDQIVFESGPQVHDEDRAVWTTMNETDRPDLRKRFKELVVKAREKLEASGQDTFEYVIK